MKFWIWVRAAVIRAASARLNRAGPTSATNSPMIVTTTSISIRVTPACERVVLLLRSNICLHRHVVNTGNRQQHAENQRAYNDTHHQDHDGLEDRGEAFDRGARVIFVNIRH